jgi:hypothetical protein
MVQSFAAGGGRTTRLLLTLLEASHFSVAVDGNDLVVAVAPGKDGNIEAVPRAAVVKQAPVASEPCKVLDVRFQHDGAHDEVVIELSALGEYKEALRGNGRRTLTLACSKLSDELSRHARRLGFRRQIEQRFQLLAPGRQGRRRDRRGYAGRRRRHPRFAPRLEPGLDLRQKGRT